MAERGIQAGAVCKAKIYGARLRNFRIRLDYVQGTGLSEKMPVLFGQAFYPIFHQSDHITGPEVEPWGIVSRKI